MRGKNNQKKRKINPAKIKKTSERRPVIIKKNRKLAPKILEIKLEKNTSKYKPISKPLG